MHEVQSMSALLHIGPDDQTLQVQASCPWPLLNYLHNYLHAAHLSRGPIRINSLQWQSCHSGSDTGHLFIWIHWELLVAAAGSAPLSQRLAFSIQVVCIHVFSIQVGCHLHEPLRNPLSTLAGPGS